jgi:hypothetical protein
VFLGLLKTHPEILEAVPTDLQPCPGKGLLFTVHDVRTLCAVLTRVYAQMCCTPSAREKLEADSNEVMCFLDRSVYCCH